MSAVTSSIDIAVPPRAVWDVVMNPVRLEEWVTIHRRLERHTATSMEQVLCLRGFTFHVTWALDASERPHHATWKGKGPGHSKATIEYGLTEIDGGTRFDYRNEFKAPFGPLGAVAGKAIVGGLSQRETDASLLRLKALCERA
ncbi:MAG TPA: SRPBCC family protein [Solirubrobacteraceae bacterium]|nr:SRPBCC family protein [Solirubrobacteraceae bacterium]